MGVEGRPSKVSTAVTLLWIAFAAGLIRGILEVSNTLQVASSSDLGIGLAIFVMIFSLLISAFFVFMIGKGKNWARIVYLVLFVIAIPITGISQITSFLINPLSGILGIGQIVLQIIALVFLFQKQSSDWFKSR
jgi:hypothetical protein